MALPMIVEMVEIKSHRPCEMCGEAKYSPRYDFRPTQFIPDHVPAMRLVCRKCVYKEVYGSKKANKAMKQKLFDKLNHIFNTKPAVS